MSRSLVLPALVLLLCAGGCSRSSSQQSPNNQPPASQPAAASTQPGAIPAQPAPSVAAGSEPTSRDGNRPPAAGVAAGSAAARPAEPASRRVTIPANTTLRVRLDTLVASDSSRVEDAVRAEVTKPVVVQGLEVVPAGSEVSGVVTEARRSGKVKGRARLAFRFEELTVGGRQHHVLTRTVAMEAPSTKRNDALKIGAPAAGGAILGALLGGKKGAAIGAGVGGGAGTAVVLATPGKEVRLTPGTVLTVKLLEAVTVSVAGDR